MFYRYMLKRRMYLYNDFTPAKHYFRWYLAVQIGHFVTSHIFVLGGQESGTILIVCDLLLNQRIKSANLDENKCFCTITENDTILLLEKSLGRQERSKETSISKESN